MRDFKYITLLPREIRVLELAPGIVEDGLVGNIRHKVLSPQDGLVPEFEALSYVWGDPSQPHSINLTNQLRQEDLVSTNEGTNLCIGNNLAVALRALRLPTAKRVLWCDSICINQTDLEERASQVQQMSDIYRFAWGVIVWLGPDTCWSTMAMETMRWVSDQVESSFIDPNTHKDVVVLKKSADKRVSESFGHLPLSAAQWLAFEQLVALDWHKRLWTYQEIVLANQKSSIVKLGKEQMFWSDFKKAFDLLACIRMPPVGYLVDESAFSSNASMISSRILASGLDLRFNFNWVEMMALSRPYECSDIRDKIFAVRGFVAPSLAQSLNPDYTKSAKDIFTSICIDHITRFGNLEFLTCCNASVSPSWVADLERLTSILSVESHATQYSPASACLIEPGILEVAGVRGAELFCDAVPLPSKQVEQTYTDFWQRLVTVIRTFISNDMYEDNSCLDKFAMMLTYGYVRDYSIERLQPVSGGSLPSLQDWRWKIQGWLNGNRDEMEDLESHLLTDRGFISKLPVGNTPIGCATTIEGDFARVPLESRSGDIIAVLLGSQHPIVLRPQSQSGYSVIGPCYHPSLSHGNALLGNDLKGWEPVWDKRHRTEVFYKEGHGFRRTDPRLDGIPFEDGYTQRFTGNGWPIWGKIGSPSQRHDPRMSEAGLKKRGVPIRKFRLV